MATDSIIFVQYTQEITTEGPDQYGFMTYRCALTMDLHTPQQKIASYNMVAKSSSRDKDKATRGLENSILKEIEALHSDFIDVIGE